MAKFPLPVQKPSERLKKPPLQKIDTDKSPIENLKKLFYRSLYSWIPLPLILIIGIPAAIWYFWSTIEKLPGVSRTIDRVMELRSIPQAHGDKFSIAIAKLDNDRDGTHRRLIADAIQGRFNKDEVELLLLERTISTEDSGQPQQAAKVGLQRAQTLLREANADVIIWGSVLGTKEEAPMRLHWTLEAEKSLKKRDDKYQPLITNFDLPELFWSDLSDVLFTLTTSELASFSGKKGSYFADQLQPFIKRMRALASADKFSEATKAILHFVLATSLAEYGQQSGDREALSESVNNFRESLKFITRERSPHMWADVQNNLGAALMTMGQQEASLTNLEAATAAYRDALNERNRDRAPAEWATTQANLGNALLALGEREINTINLEAAIAALREALKVQTRERVPLVWANTQEAIGSALVILSERENNVTDLEAAIAIFREVLKEETRERTPLKWASVQNNLGKALHAMSKYENSANNLDASILAFREALKEERLPMNRAGFQNNLGISQTELGALQNDAKGVATGVATLREALSTEPRDQYPLLWAATQKNLGGSLVTLSALENNPKYLEDAINAFRESLKEETRERVPLRWAENQTDLCSALESLGEAESNAKDFDAAITACNEALKVQTRQLAPQQWAKSQLILGLAYSKLGMMNKNLRELRLGSTALSLGWEVFREAKISRYDTVIASNLIDTNRAIAEQQSAKKTVSQGKQK